MCISLGMVIDSVCMHKLVSQLYIIGHGYVISIVTVWSWFYACRIDLSFIFQNMFSSKFRHHAFNDISFFLWYLQEECLQRLQNRIDVAYDGSILEHQVCFWLNYFFNLLNEMRIYVHVQFLHTFSIIGCLEGVVECFLS